MDRYGIEWEFLWIKRLCGLLAFELGRPILPTWEVHKPFHDAFCDASKLRMHGGVDGSGYFRALRGGKFQVAHPDGLIATVSSMIRKHLEQTVLERGLPLEFLPKSVQRFGLPDPFGENDRESALRELNGLVQEIEATERELELRVEKDGKVEKPVEPQREVDGQKAPGKKLREPCKRYLQIYRLHVAQGGSQEKTAEVVTSATRTPCNQKTVSLALNRVRAYLEAGNVLPDLIPSKAKREFAVDPRKLEKGAPRNTGRRVREDRHS